MKHLSAILKKNLMKEEHKEFKNLEVNDDFLNLLCKSIEEWIVYEYSSVLQHWLDTELLPNISLKSTNIEIDEDDD